MDRELGLHTAEVRVYPDSITLAHAAAGHILAACRAGIRAHGTASLVLAGGSTPRAVYTFLSQPDYASRLDWGRLHIFWGDERQVPGDHADSNYRMAWVTLLSNVPLPAENIHRMRGELDAAIAAQQYEQELERFFVSHAETAGNRVGFDLVLLGLGEDGHVASLFPGSPALSENERLVVAVDHTGPPPPVVPRITLTLPAINSAAQVTFIVSGDKKAEVVRRILGERSPVETLPAQRVHPANGRALWLIDRSAAAGLGDL